VKILFESGVLTFVFENGYWVASEHPSNTTQKTLRTNTAEVRFCLEFGDESDTNIYVFEEKFGKTIRKEWKLSKLLERVNSKNYTLEFLYQYKGYNSIIIECWLWSDKKPYHRECELKLSIKDVKYYWNDLCEDKEW